MVDLAVVVVAKHLSNFWQLTILTAMEERDEERRDCLNINLVAILSTIALLGPIFRLDIGCFAIIAIRHWAGMATVPIIPPAKWLLSSSIRLVCDYYSIYNYSVIDIHERMNYTMPNDPITDPQGQTPSGTDPTGQTPNSTTASGQTPNSQRTSIDSLPPDIQDYIKSLRADAKKYRDVSEAEAKAKADAEAARLAEQGEFKKLAEKHEAKVRELEPVATSYTKLAEQINAQIEAEVKDWPAEVKNLVPSSDIPAEQRLEQMTKLRPLLEKLQTQARTQLPGNRPNPSVATPAATKQAQLEANRTALLKQRGYNI